MLSKFFAAAALGSVLIAAPALAQDTTSSPKPAPSTNATSPAPSTNATSPAPANSLAISEKSASTAGWWQGSKLIGLSVYDSQNQKIGSIVQLMVDKDGAIKSVVIGVGGFLGMGERDVAVKFADLKFSNEPVPSTSSSTSSSTPSSRPAGMRSNNSTTGSASTSAPKGPSTYPDHAVLSATKDQLKAMPQFDYNK